MCSPTRASLLTGRNHHSVGSGQIAELANDWDGYSGHIPEAAPGGGASPLRVRDGRLGKWHNTPADETPGRPFRQLADRVSGSSTSTAFSPARPRSTSPTSSATRQRAAPKTPEEGYHLSEDLADDAIGWLRRHKAFEPDKPFFMYWASGCLHGPHQS